MVWGKLSKGHVTSPWLFSYNCMGIYSHLNGESVFSKKTPVACAVFLLDSAGLDLPGPPTSPCAILVQGAP